MKGIVFTEFMDMVEQVFSDEILDQVLLRSDFTHQGSYTAVGTYDHTEMVTMVTHLSALTNVPISDLLYTFGKHLFARFFQLYPQFFEQATDPFNFLKNVDQYIHVEVKKLYPDAELPQFEYRELNANSLELTYRSQRHFADFAKGLIQGCFDHFKTPVQITMDDQSESDSACILFILNAP